MKIYIGFITQDKSLIKTFNSSKESLVPKEIRTKLPKICSFKFDAFDPLNSKNNFSIESHLLHASRDFDYAACLIDTKFNYPSSDIFCALLCGKVDSKQIKLGNTKNFFSCHFTKLFKSAIFTIEKMNDSQCEQAMRLPRRNFVNNRFHALCEVYQDDVLEAHFHNTAKEKIYAVLDLKRPRRDSSYNHKYFIDDESKHFIFGKEEHSVLPTGSPHQPSCVLNGIFRFGMKISTDHHYNMSKGTGDQTYISGSFLNCHNMLITVSKNDTHLNIFTNDFF